MLRTRDETQIYLDSFIAAILANDPNLTTLSFMHNAYSGFNFDHLDIIKIMHALKSNNLIWSISFWGADLGDDGAEILADILSKQKSIIEYAFLGGANITEKGLNFIIESQKKNPKLIHFTFPYNQIDWTPQLVSDLLVNLRHVKEISFKQYSTFGKDDPFDRNAEKILDTIISLIKTHKLSPIIELPDSYSAYDCYISNIRNNWPCPRPKIISVNGKRRVSHTAIEEAKKHYWLDSVEEVEEFQPSDGIATELDDYLSQNSADYNDWRFNQKNTFELGSQKWAFTPVEESMYKFPMRYIWSISDTDRYAEQQEYGIQYGNDYTNTKTLSLIKLACSGDLDARKEMRNRHPGYAEFLQSVDPSLLWTVMGFGSSGASPIPFAGNLIALHGASALPGMAGQANRQSRPILNLFNNNKKLAKESALSSASAYLEKADNGDKCHRLRNTLESQFPVQYFNMATIAVNLSESVYDYNPTAMSHGKLVHMVAEVLAKKDREDSKQCVGYEYPFHGIETCYKDGIKYDSTPICPSGGTVPDLYSKKSGIAYDYKTGVKGTTEARHNNNVKNLPTPNTGIISTADVTKIGVAIKFSSTKPQG